MKVNTKVAISSVLVGVIAAFASLALQPPASWEHTAGQFHFSLSANVLAFFIHLGAASLFVLSLHVYKKKLQRAFLGIVLGIMLIAAGTSQLPVLDLFDQWNSTYVTSGIIGLPFLLGGLFIYFGSSKFGKLIGIGGVSANRLVVLPASILATSLTLFLPHVETTVDEFSFDASNFVLGWTGMLLIASAVVFFRTSKTIGAHYTYAVTWLGVAMLSSAACVAIAIFDTLVSTATRDPITEFLNVMTVLAGLAWLKAGYAFTKTKEY